MKFSKFSFGLLYFLYFLTLLGVSIYSYALVDTNLTLFNSPVWVNFRNAMVHLGYFERKTSWNIYLSFIILLFIFHFLFIKFYKKVELRLLLPVLATLLLSYPFLSHDLFNYMFDARILTYYHQNPYLHTALNFQQDEWLRFMQWVHRPYPYGPSFLLITLVPSFLSLGKFILNFILFKFVFLSLFFLAIVFLFKKDKKVAIILATHPLILIEGLINNHNDLVAMALGILGIYYLFEKKEVASRVFSLLSVGIKYTSLPILIIMKNKPITFFLSFIFQILILAYMSFFMGVQPWYFLTLFIYIPFYPKVFSYFNIFFAGLLLSYYSYIAQGGWDKRIYVELKEQIIIWSFVLNIMYLVFIYLKKNRKDSFSLSEIWSSKVRT